MLAVLMVHHHNCSDEIRRKTNEVEAYVKRLQIKKEAVESDVVNITLQIDEIEEEIDMLKEQKPA